MNRARLIELAIAQATDPATPDTSSQGPIIVVVLAVVTLAGTALTAMGPALVEIAKNRGSRSRGGTPPVPAGPTPPPNPAPALADTPVAPASSQMVQGAQAGLSMVEAAVLDYRSQRDAAQARYDRALDDLEEAQDLIRDQAVYIATLEGRLGMARPNYGGRHGSFPNNPQNRNPR